MVDFALMGGLDLPTLSRGYRTGETSPEEVVARLLRRVEAYPDPAVWIHLLPEDQLRAQAQALEKSRAAGENLPLFGVPFAVKDNIDVAGLPTTAGCSAFGNVPAHTAPAVQRLLRAGALLVGKTNLDQFATGLAGDRSPYGACRNVFDPEYISGGSSSGSAVAVAAGLVSFALGTDTAGSGRVPAGCNNLVGLKPTPGVISSDGLIPACQSLDCVSILALTAEDALAVWEVARDNPWPDPLASAAPLPRRASAAAGGIVAVPRDADLDFCGDTDQAALFRQAVGRLVRMGWKPLPIDFRPFRETAALLYEGPWLAERLAGLSDFLAGHAADLHPVTRAVIEGGARYSGVDVFRGMARLQALRRECFEVFGRADLLVVPTLPTIPRRVEVEADSVGWSRRLGIYTNFANLLGLAALSVPAGFTPRGLPGGITLLGPGGSDRFLCGVGMAWQRGTDLPLGATGRRLAAPGRPPAPPPPPPAPGHVRVAVAGAHLRGFPLHRDLLGMGARFVRACRTAARYRFLGFLDLDPPRPALLRDEARAGAVQVEIYDLPVTGFGRLTASVAPPLAIGTVELDDGEKVKGFLCESWAAARAQDITDFGGWAAFNR